MAQLIALGTFAEAYMAFGWSNKRDRIHTQEAVGGFDPVRLAVSCSSMFIICLIFIEQAKFI